jgi:cyclic lactone autoinducer peptide
MKKLFYKNMKHIGSLAIGVATLSANATCLWYNHQPKVPKKLKKD